MFVKRAVTVFILVFMVNSSHHSIANCPTQRVNFTIQPETEVSCEGGEASFICQYAYDGARDSLNWIINHTVYRAYPPNLPNRHKKVPLESITGEKLIISNVSLSDNSTSYQCQLELSDINSVDGARICCSSEGRLIVKHCRAPAVRCLPIKHPNGSLIGIFANITQMGGTETNYTVDITDALSGNHCDSQPIMASYSSGSFTFYLPVPATCSSSSALNVTVSTTTYAMSEPIKIEAVDDFVSITLVQTASDIIYDQINCTFFNELNETEKRCEFRHGTVVDNCENLQFTKQHTFSGTTTMQFADLDLNYLGNNTVVCIALEAFSGNKSKEIVEIFYIGAGHLPPNNDSILIPPRNIPQDKSSTRMPILSMSVYGLVLVVLAYYIVVRIAA